MPMLAELERRFASSGDENLERDSGEETLVTDHRARMSPAQLVEQKLRSVLQSGQFVAAALSGRTRRQKPR